MRVIPLTSVLSHKGRGCRCAKWDETLSLEVMELIKQALRRGPIFDASQSAARDWVRAARAAPKCLFKKSGVFPSLG